METIDWGSVVAGAAGLIILIGLFLLFGLLLTDHIETVSKRTQEHLETDIHKMHRRVYELESWKYDLEEADAPPDAPKRIPPMPPATLQGYREG
jgi:hypothetical protein